MEQIPQILYCRCAYAQVIPAQTRDLVLKALQESGAPFEAIADLCELAARCDPRLKQWATEPVRIAACFPRTVKWLFHRGQASLVDKAEILNMRTQGADEIIEALLGDSRAKSSKAMGETALCDKPWGKIGEWVPWFPVIDYERCSNCQQCLNFCLFGVYAATDDGKVEVRKPANCKLNCPACARVCPKVAIIFPKYDKSPINGDEVRESDLQQGKMGVDISSALSGDVYAALRNRREKAQKRFAVPKNAASVAQPADNGSNIIQLQKQLDIPDEVIASLNKNQPRPECSCRPEKENPSLE